MHAPLPAVTRGYITDSALASHDKHCKKNDSFTLVIIRAHRSRPHLQADPSQTDSLRDSSPDMRAAFSVAAAMLIGGDQVRSMSILNTARRPDGFNAGPVVTDVALGRRAADMSADVIFTNV